MNTQDTNPFYPKLSIIYILILFAILIGVIWWTQRTTPEPEIIYQNIAATAQKSYS